MEGNKQYNGEARLHDEHAPAETVSIEQVRHLVHLLNHSDVSEIELKRTHEGVHLVLRKAKAAKSVGSEIGEPIGMLNVSGPLTLAGGVDGKPTVETKHIVVASLVGIFHSWAKPNGKALVAVGDRIRVGQLVGTIQSLNVINEVESTVAGRVTEIFVRDGQPVEYGQQLMAIDSVEGA